MISARFDSFSTATQLARLLFEELGIESRIIPVAVSTLHNEEGIAYELDVFVKLEDPAAYR